MSWCWKWLTWWESSEGIRLVYGYISLTCVLQTRSKLTRRRHCTLGTSLVRATQTNDHLCGLALLKEKEEREQRQNAEQGMRLIRCVTYRAEVDNAASHIMPLLFSSAIDCFIRLNILELDLDVELTLTTIQNAHVGSIIVNNHKVAGEVMHFKFMWSLALSCNQYAPYCLWMFMNDTDICFKMCTSQGQSNAL